MLKIIFRGQLLQISPSDPVSELVAKSVMNIYGGASVVYAGKSSKFIKLNLICLVKSQFYNTNVPYIDRPN